METAVVLQHLTHYCDLLESLSGACLAEDMLNCENEQVNFGDEMGQNFVKCFLNSK